MLPENEKVRGGQVVKLTDCYGFAVELVDSADVAASTVWGADPVLGLATASTLAASGGLFEVSVTLQGGPTRKIWWRIGEPLVLQDLASTISFTLPEIGTRDYLAWKFTSPGEVYRPPAPRAAANGEQLVRHMHGWDLIFFADLSTFVSDGARYLNVTQTIGYPVGGGPSSEWTANANDAVVNVGRYRSLALLFDSGSGFGGAPVVTLAIEVPIQANAYPAVHSIVTGDLAAANTRGAIFLGHGFSNEDPGGEVKIRGWWAPHLRLKGNVAGLPGSVPNDAWIFGYGMR